MSEKGKTKSRYLSSKKKYLLASNTDSIQQLMDNQKEELTKILISQKSEYDKLLRESKKKREETEVLEKKIKALEGIDNKTKKESEENKERIENMTDALKIKKGRKGEEIYNQKTLEKEIIKLNQDLLLIQKEILKVENEGKRLDKKLERAKFNENKIRQQKNNIHSQVEDVNSKNKNEKNEQDLQIQYYETIIKQKYMFIQSADERKERQKKIAQEAKNDSNDKAEVEKRNELHLLILFNQYLREKMNEELKKNEEMEKTLEEIRNICGTEELDILVDIILLRGKRYNYDVQIVSQLEKNKKKLEEEVNLLNVKFNNIKSDVLIEEPNEKSKKINIIKSKYVEQSDKELIEIEKNLKKKLFDLGEKHNNVNLSYNKVIENINLLKEYYDENPIDIKGNENNKLNTNDNFTTEAEEKKLEMKEEEEEKKNENKEEEKSKEEIKLKEEEEEIINNYIYFIKESSKCFDQLFLLHSKQEFIEIMKNKGKEKIEKRKIISQSSKPKVIVRKVQKEGTNKSLLSSLSRTQKKKEKYSKTTIKAEDTQNLIKKTDDEESKNDYDFDKDIMKKFLDEQKKERNDFLQNDKDKNTKTKTKKSVKKKN